MAKHVPHLYLPGPYRGERIGTDETIRRHLEKVLRSEGPLRVTYTDGSGLSGKGVYDDGWVLRGKERTEPPPPPVTIAVASPKNRNRARFIVEKLVELGVGRLLWLETERSEGRTPRIEKASAWAQAALEQCRGSWMLEVVGPVAVGEVADFGTVIVADKDGVAVADLDLADESVLCVGPEGGFTFDELPTGATRVKLGQNVLRVETAAIVGAALLIGKTSAQ